MKALRNQIDKIKPHFEKGGKFYFLHSTFDAFETFLFVPNHTTKSGAHIRDAIDSKRTMIIVVLALLPAMFFGCWNVGYQHDLALGLDGSVFSRFWLGFGKFFPILVVSYVVALGIEFAFAQIKGHEVNEGVLVTGFLIPLIMPPTIPLWMVAVSTAFAIIFGKEVFGGTGMNVFNPALVARAFLFFSYPSKISGVEPWVYTGGQPVVDGFSAATPLGNAGTGEFDKLASTWDAFVGTIPGSIGETSFIAIMIGALILLLTGIGSWRIMLSVFAGGALMAWIFNLIGANEYMQTVDPVMHLVYGGFAFGAVFMATDPVSAAQTNTGKYIYGFLIGIFTILIRVINPAYPEGMMLSILLMNTFAPLIDYYVVEANIRKRTKRVKLVNK
ncbi:MAG TPA: NADH:ubiquinone reductase (Na(+)-transporting) subunit B [Bacteroidia bacterium]|nr:NADH:ubiquinone reductase (Na(+)-transporting) subunit B [Sphingobacteriales bacterium]HPD64924.1 NADH:ubiquinone reductase (Na(+)-transporting) subunit B [Bacteroidia bacterium]HRS58361.1 NADH:ubiquinone reductase (Na(+)-transporting) subunit B [Bacteroidia bacterium]HRU69408.1 NADH:ubiquinone reductase (Na(+)-transporting) subunit B [Bacteroidia bacterium]